MSANIIRKLASSFLLLFLLVSSLTALAPLVKSPIGVSHVVNAQTPPATLKIGVLYDFIQPINPFVYHYTFEDYLMNFMFDHLAVMYQNGTVAPELAQSWTFSPDGKSLTFHLVKNATWSDGVPITSQDVKYTWDVANASGAGSYYSPTQIINWTAGIQTPDNYTVIFPFKTAYASAIPEIGFQYVAPMHQYSQVTNMSKILTYQPTQIVTSGPYLFTSRTPQQSISISANPNYYGKKAQFSQIIFLVYSTQDSMVLGLLHGDISAAGGLKPQYVPTLDANPSIKVTVTPTSNVVYLYLNIFNYPFNITAFRQALTLGVNKSEQVNTALLGYAQIGCDSVASPALGYWFNPNYCWLGNNLTATQRLSAANSLLDGLGFTMGSDGVRSTPNGTRLSFNVYYYSATFSRQMQLLASEWAQIGIQATPVLTDVATENSKLTCPPCSFSVALWGYGINDPSDLAYQYVGLANYYGFFNSTLANVLNQEEATVNITQRQQLVFKAEQLFEQSVPFIVMYEPQLINAHYDNVYTGWASGALEQPPAPLVGDTSRYSIQNLVPAVQSVTKTSVSTSIALTTQTAVSTQVSTAVSTQTAVSTAVSTQVSTLVSTQLGSSTIIQQSVPLAIYALIAVVVVVILGVAALMVSRGRRRVGP